MNLIDSLLSSLRLHEGFRAKPYLDTVGVLTIGYGRNLQANGISVEEAEFMLRNDVLRVISQLNEKLPWLITLNDVRRLVLYNMAFNLGVDGLLTFKNTLKAVEEGRYDDAAEGMLASKWASQVKGRAVELAAKMRTGV